MRHTLAELIGFESKSYKHWDPHFVVGLSCFGFAPGAAAFWAVFLCLRESADPKDGGVLLQLVLYPILAVLYTLVVVASYCADYLFIKRLHRSFYGRVDIALASCTFFLSIFDFWLRATIWHTMLLVFIACSAFVWSGQSTSFEIWVWRHTWWHVVGGGIALYGALGHLPVPERILMDLPSKLILTEALYGLCIGLFLAGRHLAGKERLQRLWQSWAVHANWELRVKRGAAKD
ncbi:unnamed protein product [Effrenium voratum]|nr:unnamed protein product [Effrenium voratum]